MTATLPVAVIVPCFNDGATLEEALASVAADRPEEVVVVDDGSTDEATLEVLRAHAASGGRVVRQANAGVSAARMRGVAETQSPLILALDADDKLAPGALKRMVDAMDEDPGVAVVWGDVERFGSAGYLRYPKAATLDPWRITFMNELVASTLIRRSAIEATSGWQLGGLFEDWDLWMAMAERGMRGKHVGGVTLLYRAAGGRGFSRGLARQDEIARLLRRRHAALFRRRRHNRASANAGIPLKLAWTFLALLPLPPRYSRYLFFGALVVCEPSRRRRRTP